MSLGESLRQAREAKGQTLSQVAEATRMMVQVVEDLEREDFRRIAAPIYGRGFIKLYAEHLEIDPEPLIREFMEIYTGSRPPQNARRAAAVEELATPVPATEPADRPETIVSRRSDVSIETDLPVSDSVEPDLFSVAAGRVAAVRSVAEPSLPGDATPPRVRPAATAHAAAAMPAPSAPRLERTSLRAMSDENTSTETPQLWNKLTAMLPPDWSPAKIGVALASVVVAGVLVALLVHALRHKKPVAHPSAASHATVTVKHALPPPAPYFN